MRSVYAAELGRLMYLRVVGQNAVIINFPVPVPKGTALDLQVVYGGRIEPQELDREAIVLDQEQEPVLLQPEPRYIYSNRSYWYPQAHRRRLRHRATRDHRARRVRRGRQRHASGTADARGRTRTAGRTRAQVVRLQLPDNRCATSPA